MRKNGKQPVGRKKVSKVRVKPAEDENVEGVEPVEETPEDVPELQGEDGDAGDYSDTDPHACGEEGHIGPSGVVWKSAWRRVGDLTEWDRNPRRLTDSQAKHIATSIIKFGYVETVQVNLDNKIIGGHQRTRVMLQAGMINADTLLEVRVPSRLLDKAEHEELAVRMNKNTGDWDYDILTTQFDQNELREWGFSPMDFGIAATKGVDFTPVTPVTPMKETSLKPSKPRTCTHCEQRCHCVVEE